MCGGSTIRGRGAREGGTQVMQWHPDLKGPLQYLTSADHLTNSESGSGVALAGSQYPAEVTNYPFNHGGDHAITTPLTTLATVENEWC